MSVLAAVWDWLGRAPAEPAERERKVKEPYPYRFNPLMFALALAFIALAVLVPATIFRSLGEPLVRTSEVPQPALSSKSTAEDARARYGKPAQTVAGTEIGLPEGIACDVYELSDGLSLVCYRGGS